MRNQLINAPRPAIGLAAQSRGSILQPWSFERRALRQKDVALEVLYCGVCRSDLHAIDKWSQQFPLVPGHEIVGRVTECGKEITDFIVGDLVAVGTIVDSCRTCEPCEAKEESYCLEFPTTTYNGIDRVDGSLTQGGYSTHYVCEERFVFHIPDGLDPAGAAPLLCAGVTTFEALRQWDVGVGKKIGVVGIGGLGHMAIKFGAALGAHVVAFTRSRSKADSASALGAHSAVLSTEPGQMKALANSLDLIIDTVSEAHPLNEYVKTLKVDGTLVSLGIPDAFEVQPYLLAMARRKIASSGTGGTKIAREMLEFCSKHNIVADVEVIAPEDFNAAAGLLRAGYVKYRFVLDLRNGIG